MEKVRKMERVAALTKILADRPQHLFSLSYFSELFGFAKSTICEDITTIKETMGHFGLGTVETVAGAAGGVRFVPTVPADEADKLLHELACRLAEPDRIIPGGFLYMSDLLFTPHLMVKAGEIFMERLAHLSPDYILTVETKGIPLAFMVARAFDLPLITVRRGSRVTEGSSVSINYVTGSSKRIQTMSLPKRALPAGARVLVIDDFMKAGGTAKGMVDLAQEVGAEVTGIGVLVATAEPEHKLVEDYLALLILHDIDEHTKVTDIRPVLTTG
ncbi:MULTISPECIES: pur operon repressor [Sporomusa]|uniref:Pur operon repressor n=2 Tax=Sporomusa TaxID=2375 RepID=A0ABM9W0I7_9FIRM|nr:pur operon repressor [Sporomusa sphaeroides]MCM0761318.1 pur operon repressor [Sporomusa sphaeroides DSM 2875]OLS56676.1 Pur operon repressor [Sporomusa sphaeroides DSM 2875]CVK18623.1 Pur operon repressor [Sporomusa sphaeroides DSM 2875]HML32667.1 pur operon repressor [Sporomusa sphaeroides]